MSHLWLLMLLLSYFIFPSHEFPFYFTSTPTQCANMTVEWTGGQAPFTLLLVPVGRLYPETRRIIQRDVQSGSSVSFVLVLPAQSQFVAVLNDASGIGAGGTSAITTVAPSSDSSCLSTTPSQPAFFLFLPEDIEQCVSVGISWGSGAEEPVGIIGLIPGGESFEIANVTDSSTSFQWTANVRSGTQIMFVAGDRDGLGSGGSSDVMEINEGNSDRCIDDTSPSSTTGVVAGGVSSTSQDSSGTQSSSSDAGVGTKDGSGSTPITTTDNAGSTVTIGGGGSTGTSVPDVSSTESPGSGGGTVTGRPPNRKLGLILGLIFGLLAIGLIIGGAFLYRRRRRGGVYRNLETDGNVGSDGRPWVTALARGAHLRGGAGSSTDTLPSMYQTEPFILPLEHEPYVISPQEPPSTQYQRPEPATRASSSLVQSLLGQGPFARDAFGSSLAGMHGSDRKGSIGPHGRSVSRSPSGRIVTRAVFPPPSLNIPATRVTRDSEDFSPEPEEMSPNPFDDTIIEIPPTYASVRRASKSNDPEPSQPVGTQLTRSNASRISRRSMLSEAADGSHESA